MTQLVLVETLRSLNGKEVDHSNRNLTEHKLRIDIPSGESSDVQFTVNKQTFTVSKSFLVRLGKIAEQLP